MRLLYDFTINTNNEKNPKRNNPMLIKVNKTLPIIFMLNTTFKIYDGCLVPRSSFNKRSIRKLYISFVAIYIMIKIPLPICMNIIGISIIFVIPP